MPASLPFTRSGACAACGAYGGSQHRPTCQPRSGRTVRLGPSRRARRDGRTSAAALAVIALERDLVARL